MSYPKTDEEKVKLVKDLFKRAYEAMEAELDKQMEKVELEWIKEKDDSSKD